MVTKATVVLCRRVLNSLCVFVLCVCVVDVQRDGMAKYQKEEEEKTLKAITLFCFPEGINWAPLTEYHRSV